MSGSTAGLRPISAGLWSQVLTAAYAARYRRLSNGFYAVEIRALPNVYPAPELVRAELTPQPTLELARKVALRYLETLQRGELAELEAGR